MPYRIGDSESYSGLEVAIIGMSGKFPGAQNVEQFWTNLVENRETLTHFEKSEINDHILGKDIIHHPDYVRTRGVIQDIEYFDAPLFGYSPQEATLLDPQVRQFHECAWEALEDASYNPLNTKASIGVFAGAHTNAFWESSVLSGYNDTGSYSNKDYLSTRLSYKLNLKGPSQTLYTACSTSLVAVHMACRSLLSGECDMAIAGAASIELTQERGYLYMQGDIQSKSGHNRSFDAGADGTVFSNGTGVVVLKLLEDAIEDRDNIHAVIKGSAINNDGDNKVSFMAPSVNGQADVVKKALAFADVEPENLVYIEAHGSATNVGDPIEVKALKQVFGSGKQQRCGIGSVKSNIGHTNTASGIAGLIKTILATKNRLIPKSLHYTTPNPRMELESSPFYVVEENQDISEFRFPVKMGVSSFGVGGTNAHAIIEEAPAWVGNAPDNQPRILAFSAKSQAALNRNIQAHQKALREYISGDLSNYSYSLNRREPFAYRAFLVAHSSSIDAWDRIQYGSDTNSATKFVVFYFGQIVVPGQVQPLLDRYKRLQTLQAETFASFGDDLTWEHFSKQPENTILVSFILQFSLGKFLIELGVLPSKIIAHGIGELVALALNRDISLFKVFQICRGKFATGQYCTVQHPYYSINQELISGERSFEVLQELLSVPEQEFSISDSDNLESSCLIHFCGDSLSMSKLPQQEIAVVSLLGNESENGEISDWLNGLGKLWLAGTDINWEILYGEEVRKISIPTYSFDKHHFWIKEPDFEVLRNLNGATTNEAGQASLLQPIWKQKPLGQRSSDFSTENLLVIGENTEEVKALQYWGRDRFLSVVRVEPRADYSESEGTILLNFSKREEFSSCLRKLNDRKAFPDRVLFVASENGKDSYQHLIDFLAAYKNVANTPNLQVHVITQSLFQVLGNEVPQAQAATLIGPALVVPQERPGIHIQLVDTDKVEDLVRPTAILENTLGAEDRLLAIRNGRRWAREFEVLPNQKLPDQLPLFKDGGNYVVLGGLGRMSLHLVSYISQFVNSNFHLVSRGRKPLDQKANQLLETIRGNGCTVQQAHFDISNRASLSQYWEKLHADGQQVDGLIHAAGELNEGTAHPFEVLSAEQSQLQFGAKVATTEHLVELFEQGAAPKFCLLMSSLSSLLGGLGYTAYSAANAYLDQVAGLSNSRTQWMSINWDTWAYGGEEKLPQYFLPKEKATLAFHKALSLPELTQVVVADGSMDQRLAYATSHTVWGQPNDSAIEPMDLSGSKLEIVRTIWAKYLGYDQIADYDDFFEIGGDSMVLISVIDEISRTFQKKITLEQFYQHSQLKALVEILDKSDQYQVAEISKAPIKEVYPLSPAQYRMYYQYSLDPENTNYNERKVFELEGQTDISRLKASIQFLADRHEALRTSFEVQGDEVIQRIQDTLEIEVKETTISHSDIKKYAEEVLRPFNLEKAPVWRTEIVRTADQRQYLITDFHHIIYDATSMSIMQSDLLHHYSKQALEPVAIQYKDYAEYTNSAEYQIQRGAFQQIWRDLMAGYSGAVMLPFDWEGAEELEEGYQAITLQEKVHKRVDQFCINHSVSTSSFMAIMFNLLFSRYCGTDDVSIGMPLHGRIQNKLSQTVGMFVNILPFRTRIPSGGTFADYLEDTQRMHLQLLETQDYPLNDLVKDLKEHAGISAELFKATYNMVSKTMTAQRNSGLDNIIIGELPMNESRVSKYEFIINITEYDNTIEVGINFPANRYSADTISNMLSNYQLLIGQVVAEPAITMDQLQVETAHVEPEFDISMMDEEMEF